MSDTILEVKNIVMEFPGVRALDNVQFSLQKGEIHALIGENGAGKSTLMKILLGLYKATAGEIYFEGKQVFIHSPTDALRLGISMIHQEISLVSTMTVDENIWLGREKDFCSRGFLNVGKRMKKTKALLERIGIHLNPEEPVKNLSIASMQLVEIVRAVSYDSKVIIMDEPTSALTSEEIENLLKIIRDLARQGVAIIFISHKLEELLGVCDRVTVLRDGQFVATKKIEEIDKNELVKLIVGREITDMYPKRQPDIGACIFEVQDLNKKGVFEHISFQLHKGEILGFCGLMGAGRTEILEAIFGIEKFDSGQIVIDGKQVELSTPKSAIQHGLGMVTEDRLRRGVIHKLSVKVNLSIAYITRICKWLFIQTKRENEDCTRMIEELKVKVSNPNQVVSSLSGGNQQKVIIGRCLLTEPKVLMLDEPTRGIDVGSKAEIYKLMNRLAQEGLGIIMVSSELPEVMGMSDRILVISKGRIAACVDRADFDQERLMSAAFGTA